MCSNKDLLKNELHHLETVFCDINGYPTWLIRQVIKQVKQKHTLELTPLPGPSSQSQSQQNETTLPIVLPYAGQKGTQLVNCLKRLITRNIPSDVI